MNQTDIPLSRRSALAAGAGLVGGVGVMHFGASDVAAQVAVDEFTVADAQFDEQISPVVDARLAWRYEVDADVDSVRIGLTVDDQELAHEELSTSTQAAEATTELAARVLNHDGYTAGDFETATETQLLVGATIAVVDRNGDAIVENSAEDTATVAIVDRGDASIGGEAAIVPEGE